MIDPIANNSEYTIIYSETLIYCMEIVFILSLTGVSVVLGSVVLYTVHVLHNVVRMLDTKAAREVHEIEQEEQRSQEEVAPIVDTYVPLDSVSAEVFKNTSILR